MASEKKGNADVELNTDSVQSSHIQSSHAAQMVRPLPNLSMSNGAAKKKQKSLDLTVEISTLSTIERWHLKIGRARGDGLQP